MIEEKRKNKKRRVRKRGRNKGKLGYKYNFYIILK
jgi:hypothetical protein